MIVSERDKIAAKALIEILNKAKFELVGSETMVVARVMAWAADMEKRIGEALLPLNMAPQPTIPVDPPKPSISKSKAKKAV